MGPIKVPRQLLLHRGLTAPAKLLWVIVRSEVPSFSANLSRTLLAQRSGLSRRGVELGLSQLQRECLMRPLPIGRADNDWAAVPRDLLSDLRLKAQPKVFYAMVQMLPEFWLDSVETSYTRINQVTGLSPNTIKDAIRPLVQHGWLDFHQPTRLSPILLTLRNPAAESAEIAVVTRRLDRSPYLGEALMREYLTLLVDSDEYDDDTSPGFLINPYTGEELQFDRYYPPYVAFEFNGAQHYGPTAMYPDEEEARKQQGRDLIKQGICAIRGIRLICVHPEDLSLEGMLRKVQGLLPLRNLDGKAELIAYLESRARQYRRKSPTR